MQLQEPIRQLIIIIIIITIKALLYKFTLFIGNIMATGFKYFIGITNHRRM